MWEAGKKMVFLLFFASGISALIYEVVWLRILSRIIGLTTYATAIVLAAFMGGLALGSFIFGKFIDRHRNPLKTYALLQLAIAVVASLMPIFFKASVLFYQSVYKIMGHYAGSISMLRTLISFGLLLIPTTIMGGTLPALVSHKAREGGLFGKNLSLLYGINTLGAVFGVVLSGFITIGAIGEWNTIFIGVLINSMAGFAAFILYRKTRYESVNKPELLNMPVSPYPNNIRKIVLIAILTSGFTALAYEVIWTRQLILFLKNSIYSFSGMLAIFLIGLALGSMFINRFVDAFKSPLVIFGILELGIGIISIFNLKLLSPLHSMLYPLYDMSAPLSRGLLWNYLAPVILVFPLTFLFGAIFPVASICYTKSLQKGGSSVGMLYGFNTIGNVGGALLAGFLFISLIGSSRTVVMLGFINVALGLLLLWAEPTRPVSFKLKYLLAIPAVIFLSASFKGRDPFLNIIEEKIKRGAESYEIFYNRESIEGTVTSYSRNGIKNLMINGVWEANKATANKLMIHIPVLLASKAEKILIICFGTGTTAHSASIYDADITCVELIPDLYKCFKYYHPDAEKILENFNIVAGDGRNFLLLSSDKYDIITVDPSYPIYSAGTVNLYTQEFLNLCREHLTEDGVMSLWYPGGTQVEGRLVLRTFYSVFPHMSVWRVSSHGGGGWLLIGMLKTQNIDKSKIEKAFKNIKFLNDLNEYKTSRDLLDLLLEDDTKSIKKETSIVTDNYPYFEFPLWRYILGSPLDGSRRSAFSLIRKRN